MKVDRTTFFNKEITTDLKRDPVSLASKAEGGGGRKQGFIQG